MKSRIRSTQDGQKRAGRKVYIVRVATSNFVFGTYNGAVKQMMEFSANDKLKYVIYRGYNSHKKGLQRPICIIYKGRVYRQKSWLNKNIIFSNFINSL